METNSSQFNCPSDDISAYLDGELSAGRELELERHFAACGICHSELNSQKQFLRGLEFSLRSETDVDLPTDFTRHLVANAESSVSGLRRPRERFNALFICAGMGLFALFALGADVERLLTGVLTFFAQAASVAGIVGHMVYTIFLGAAIIIRSLAAQVSSDAVMGVIATAALLTVTLWFASRTLLRMRRA